MNQAEKDIIAKTEREWHEHPFGFIQVSLLLFIAMIWVGGCLFWPLVQEKAFWVFVIQTINTLLFAAAHYIDKLRPPGSPMGSGAS